MATEGKKGSEGERQTISIERARYEHLCNSHDTLLVVLRAILSCDIPLRYGLREQAEEAVKKATSPPTPPPPQTTD